LASSKDIAFLSKSLATIKLDVELLDFNLNDFGFNPKNILNENVFSFFEKYEFNSLI
jgi:5'-3' exonuclease